MYDDFRSFFVYFNFIEFEFFFHVFRYSINFWGFEFSIMIKTMCCSMRKSYIVCINTLFFPCNFGASLILFRYSIALMVEIWFFNFAIMRLLNHTFAQLYVRFCSFCKILFFVHFSTFSDISRHYLCSQIWWRCDFRCILIFVLSRN